MRRVLVVTDRPIRADIVVRGSKGPAHDVLDVFVLLAIRTWPTRVPLVRPAVWSDAWRQLDRLLAELAERGVLCDGLAVAGDPVVCARESAMTFQPHLLVIAATRRLRRLSNGFPDAVDAETAIRWLQV